jgi:hypothetical protein
MPQRVQSQMLLSLLVLMISLGACTKTQIAPYQNRASADASNTPYQRLIEVQIDHQFFEDRPDCVQLLPMTGSARHSPLGQLVEKYLALHLGFRFDSVILGHERDRTKTRVGLKRMNVDDRRRFRKDEVCGYEIAFKLIHARADFVLLWARLRLGLETQLIRAGDNRVLWKARHIATRSEGGIAVSPFGAVSSAMEAAALMSDGDQMVSLVADLTRRIVGTLPSRKQGYEAYCRLNASNASTLCAPRMRDPSRKMQSALRNLEPSRSSDQIRSTIAH